MAFLFSKPVLCERTSSKKGGGMNYEQLHNFLMQQQGAQLSHPFREDTAVYKVMDKMFALMFVKETQDGQSVHLNLKCDPDEALALRATYSNVVAGYHMSKKHWNTIIINQFGEQEIPDTHIASMMRESYCLVFKGLTKVKQTQCLLLK